MSFVQGFAPPPLSLLSLPPPCEDELYAVGRLKGQSLLRSSRSSDVPSLQHSSSSTSMFLTPSLGTPEGRNGSKPARKRRSFDQRLQQTATSCTSNEGLVTIPAATSAFRNVLAAPFAATKALASSSSHTSSRPLRKARLATGNVTACDSQTSPCRNKSNHKSSWLPTIGGGAEQIEDVVRSRAEVDAGSSASDLWTGSIDAIDSYMDVLRRMEAHGTEKPPASTPAKADNAIMAAQASTKSDCQPLNVFSSTATPTPSNSPSRSKHKLFSWMRSACEVGPSINLNGFSSVTASDSAVGSLAAGDESSSIWPIDESLANSAQKSEKSGARLTCRGTMVPPTLEWGGAARQLWGQNHGHRHRDALGEAERSRISCSAECEACFIADSQDTEAHFERRATCTDSNFYAQGKKKCHKEDLLSHDTPQLTSWATFEKAYISSLLDVSVIPKKPNGIPAFQCCPDATPLDTGRLVAPQPPWEMHRLRTLYRTNPFTLPFDALTSLCDVLDEASSKLGVNSVWLHFMDREKLYQLKRDGLVPDSRSRAASFAGHMLLNRNNGMISRDVQKDWRFQGDSTNRCLVRFYASMPVLSSNGLPIAAVSAVDFSPRDDLELTHQLRQLARVIGSVLEAHHRREWCERICAMARNIHQLRHLLLLEDTFSFESTITSSTKNNRNRRHAIEKALSDAHDPEGVIAMGLYLTAADFRCLRSVLATVAIDTQMEVVCLVLLPLSNDKDSKQDPVILSMHDANEHQPLKRNADPSKDRAKFCCVPSRSFFSSLFAKTTDKTQKTVRNENKQGCTRYVLRQNLCLPNESTPKHENYFDGSGPWIELSDEERLASTIQATDMHPLTCSKLGKQRGFSASLTVPIARRANVGLAIALLTRKIDKIIGIEDLRYLEALRPFITNAFYSYGMASADDDCENVGSLGLIDTSVPAVGVSRTVDSSTRRLSRANSTLSTQSHITRHHRLRWRGKRSSVSISSAAPTPTLTNDVSILSHDRGLTHQKKAVTPLSQTLSTLSQKEPRLALLSCLQLQEWNETQRDDGRCLGAAAKETSWWPNATPTSAVEEDSEATSSSQCLWSPHASLGAQLPLRTFLSGGPPPPPRRRRGSASTNRALPQPDSCLDLSSMRDTPLLDDLLQVYGRYGSQDEGCGQCEDKWRGLGKAEPVKSISDASNDYSAEAEHIKMDADGAASPASFFSASEDSPCVAGSTAFALAHVIEHSPSEKTEENDGTSSRLSSLSRDTHFVPQHGRRDRAPSPQTPAPVDRDSTSGHLCFHLRFAARGEDDNESDSVAASEGGSDTFSISADYHCGHAIGSESDLRRACWSLADVSTSASPSSK